MSADLEQLLHDTAPSPARAPDPADLVRRGTRRRRLRHAATGALVASVVGLAAIGVAAALQQPMTPDVIDAPTIAPATPAPDESPSAAPGVGPTPDGDAIEIGPTERTPFDLADHAPSVLVATGEQVVAVGLDGTPHGFVRDARLARMGPNGEAAAPGPVLFQDPDGTSYVVPNGTLALPEEGPTGWWPLVNDHRLEFTWTRDPGAFVVLDGNDVERIVRNAEPILSWTINDERDLVSDRPAVGSPGLYDLRTSDWVDLPEGCLATDRHPDRDAYLLSCRAELPTAPAGEEARFDQLRWSDGGAPSIVATTGNGDPVPGLISDAWVSPDARHLLVQHWPDGCAPTAWIAAVDGDAPAAPALTDDSGNGVPSTILGWTDDGSALVYAGTAEGTDCGAVEEPGLWRVDPAEMETERLWAGPLRVGPADVQLMTDGPTSTWIEQGDSTAAREVLDFLRAPSATTAEDAGIADGVGTGFPTELDATVDDVLDPAAWQVELDGRGRDGRAGVFDVLRGGALEVGTGDPGHCASTMTPDAPDEVASGHTRHWIRAAPSQMGCLGWFVIDVWVRNADGAVTAVTFDLYEP